MTAPRILIADDQPDVLVALRLLLKGEGYQTVCVDHPDALLKAALTDPPSLVLMDLNYTRDTTSGQEGLDLLARLETLPDPPPVIVMTAWGSIELTVEAMRRGARDFVLKPWDNDRLLDTLRKHLRPERPVANSLERDLQIARQVQSQLLPKRKPQLKTLSIDAHCRQAGLVGGDSYDFLDLDANRTGITLADISGKGIGAALLMAHLQAALRSLAWQAPRNLPMLLRTLNLQFLDASPPECYTTLFFGDYDDATRTLRYANCGHPAPLMIRADGSVERLSSTAPVIGLLDRIQPEVAETQFQPGDTLVIYSDGATEPWDDGEEMLLRTVRESPRASAAELTARLSAAQTQQMDDITLVLATATEA